ncbi:hypothetical protein FOCG_18507 [Fusarium oxysporum f. sp. radicis-lycopersici 26381]|nr:hypothetical protein FOCG_18507 [Fusarium oxysporum f. sp. radicis-lycopersici 26381]
MAMAMPATHASMALPTRPSSTLVSSCITWTMYSPCSSPFTERPGSMTAGAGFLHSFSRTPRCLVLFRV